MGPVYNTLWQRRDSQIPSETKKLYTLYLKNKTLNTLKKTTHFLSSLTTITVVEFP